MTARSGHSFFGGLRWQGGFAFWPLVRLTIAPNMLELCPVAGIAGRFIPHRELDLAAFVCAERITRVGPFPAPGIRLRLRHEPPIIFWTLRPRRVLALLEQGGIA